MNQTPHVNIDAWDAHFEAVFGRHLRAGAYPRDALLGIVTDRHRSARKVNLYDEDTIRNAVWDLGYDGTTGVHYRVCPLINRAYTYREAGTGKDSLAWPALVADWDTADGAHAPFPEGSEFHGYRFPDRSEIAAMLDKVMPDTFRVNTGGGLQSVFALAEPMDSQDPRVKSLLKRIQRNWATYAHQHGFGIDLSVGPNMAGTQRAAGTVNPKPKYNGHQVTVVKNEPHNAYTAYHFEDLMKQFPEPAPEPRRRTSPVAKKAARRWSKASDKFAAGVPVTFLMEELWGMECRREEDSEAAEYGRWAFPRPDGSFGAETHVATMTNAKGVQAAFAHGNRAREAWGIESASIPVTSWDLLLLAVGGDLEMADIFASTYSTPDPSLVEGLENLAAYDQTA